MHNCFNSSINGFNITFIRGPGASRPGMMRQRNMNSNFIQRDGDGLYDKEMSTPRSLAQNHSYTSV
jgi:hypothetical protein